MLMDFAIHKLIAPGGSDPRIRARIGIFHVDAGNAFSLEDFFRNRSGGIESHGHIRVDGKMEQYRDTDFEADANYWANPFALSFETQGLEFGTWNDAQLATIMQTISWGNKFHRIPLRVPDSWNDPEGGWGYHTMFREWHPFPKSCPGPHRKEQFHDIIVPWMRNGEDMFDADDEARLKRIEASVEDLAKGFTNFRRNTLSRDVNFRKRLAKELNTTEKAVKEVLAKLEEETSEV